MEENWKIITELFESNWLLKQCFFITKDINQAEFYQTEIILKLYDLKNLQMLYKKNEHKPYISKLIFNELTDKRKKNVLKYELENTLLIEDYLNYENNYDKED